MLYLGLLLLGCSQLALAKHVTYDWSIDWVRRNPDGVFPRPVIGINGEWPCPQIDVDLGDSLPVNLYNTLGNDSTSLHWHGLGQYSHATMDGTSGASQCPIPPNSSFTYTFPVSQVPLKLRTDTDSSIDYEDRILLVPLAYSGSISRWSAGTAYCPRPEPPLRI